MDKTVEIELATKPKMAHKPILIVEKEERRTCHLRIFYLFLLCLALVVGVCIAVGLCWATLRNPDVDVDLGHNRDPRETKETWLNQTYTIDEYRGVFLKWVSLSYPHRVDPFRWQWETYRDSNGTEHERCCIATEYEENWKIAALSLAVHPPVTLLEKRIWFDWATWTLQLSGGTPSKYNWMSRNLYDHIVKELKTQYHILLSEALLSS